MDAVRTFPGAEEGRCQGWADSPVGKVGCLASMKTESELQNSSQVWQCACNPRAGAGVRREAFEFLVTEIKWAAFLKITPKVGLWPPYVCT